MTEPSSFDNVTMTPVGGYEQGLGVTVRMATYGSGDLGTDSFKQHFAMTIPALIEFHALDQPSQIRCLPEQHAVCLAESVLGESESITEEERFHALYEGFAAISERLTRAYRAYFRRLSLGHDGVLKPPHGGTTVSDASCSEPVLTKDHLRLRTPYQKFHVDLGAKGHHSIEYTAACREPDGLWLHRSTGLRRRFCTRASALALSLEKNSETGACKLLYKLQPWQNDESPHHPELTREQRAALHRQVQEICQVNMRAMSTRRVWALRSNAADGMPSALEAAVRSVESSIFRSACSQFNPVSDEAEQERESVFEIKDSRLNHQIDDSNWTYPAQVHLEDELRYAKSRRQCYTTRADDVRNASQWRELFEKAETLRYRAETEGTVTPLHLRELSYLAIDMREAGGLPGAVTQGLRWSQLLPDQMTNWMVDVHTLASNISQQHSRWYPLRLERLCRYTRIVGSGLLLTHPS